MCPSFQILERVFPLLLNHENVVHIKSDDESGPEVVLKHRRPEKVHPVSINPQQHPSSQAHVMVVGDIHGQLGDLVLVVSRYGRPSPQHKVTVAIAASARK